MLMHKIMMTAFIWAFVSAMLHTFIVAGSMDSFEYKLYRNANSFSEYPFLHTLLASSILGVALSIVCLLLKVWL